MKSWPHSSAAACTLAVGALVLMRACDCTGASPEAAEAGGGMADSATEDRAMPRDAPAEAPKDTGSDEKAPAVCNDPPPADLPGWEINSEWSCNCKLFEPGPGAALPQQGTWETCPTPGPENVDCRILTPPAGWYPWMPGASWAINPDTGKANIAISYSDSPKYLESTRRLFVVQEVDGPIIGALVQVANPDRGCFVMFSNMNEGKLLLSVMGNNTYSKQDFTKQAILGGAVGASLAHLLYVYDPPPFSDFILSSFVSSELLVRATITFGRAASDWSLSSWQQVHETGSDPEGLPAFRTVIRGKDVFFQVNQGGNTYVMSWDPVNGERPLLRWYGDPLQGAGNLGSDGKQMVWTYAVRSVPNTSFKFDQFTMMTGPHTTDPAVLQAAAKPVREEYDPIFLPDAAYAVGCGYAAHTTLSSDLVVVRLADGAGWVVKRLPQPDKDKWSFGPVMGVTCDEVFVGESSQALRSIARISLSSLGEPNLPPP